jgi:hypothetical protein
VRKLQSPELFSYAKNKLICLNIAHGTDSLHNLFNLPMSVEAFNQFQELQMELSTVILNEMNDKWIYNLRIFSSVAEGSDWYS